MAEDETTENNDRFEIPVAGVLTVESSRQLDE
jgi:hypothetical protein